MVVEFWLKDIKNAKTHTNGPVQLPYQRRFLPRHPQGTAVHGKTVKATDVERNFVPNTMYILRFADVSCSRSIFSNLKLKKGEKEKRKKRTK
jgi:hypothetical protein